MRDRKRQKRKVWKGILTVCMIVLLAAGTAFSLQEKVRAMNAPAASCINMLALYDQNGEMIVTTPAIGVQGSPSFVISVFAGNASFAYAQFVTSNNAKYDLEYSGGNENLNLSMWSIVGDVGQDSAFLPVGSAYEGETVAAVFYCKVDEQVNVLYQEMTLIGWKENLLIADNYPSGDIFYPASIVDPNGQLVGVYVGEGVAWDLWGSEESFYGSGGSGGSDNPGGSGGSGGSDNPGGSGGSGGSDNPGGSGGSGGSRDTAPALRGIFSSDDDDEEEEKEEGNGLLIPILIGVLIVVVVAAVVLVVVLVGRKNKKSAATPTAPSPGIGTPSQGVPSQGGTGQFWLAARGGRMDGRVYPVDNREITIGRDVSSTICYPADTPGVSRVHAKLYREGARLMLMDCSSTAGTFLNRIGRLEPMRPVEVYAGDVFYVGEASNSFEIKS